MDGGGPPGRVVLRRGFSGRFGAALTAVVLAGGRAGGTGDGGNGVAGIVVNVGMAGIDGDEIGYEG